MNESAKRSPAGPLLLSTLVRHYGELVGYVRARFKTRQGGFARDVVHDVCVRLMERPSPDAVQVPLAMLRRMVHDAAVDHCRGEDARSRWIEPLEWPPEVASPAPDPWQIVHGELELARLVAIIQAMPLRRRQVFILHKIHDVSQSEVAARMCITLKMVEKHMRLAMAACRTQLGRG
jgi:RNA polymerase sigma-70 factor (ECF subfamily)